MSNEGLLGFRPSLNRKSKLNVTSETLQRSSGISLRFKHSYIAVDGIVVFVDFQFAHVGHLPPAAFLGDGL